MQKLIYEILIGNAGLQALLAGDANVPGRQRVYEWGSLGKDNIPAKPGFPFLVIFENPSVVHHEVDETANSQTRFWQIYCYDEHGTGYAGIDMILRLVRDALCGMPGPYRSGIAGLVSPSGARCTDVEWTGISSMSRDPELNANMKYVTFKTLSNQ